jgi:YjbE family integral membrane protein
MALFSFHIVPPSIAALLQVILIDIVLAGDNAVVIGLSAGLVPKPQRRRVIFWGLAAAVIFRIVVAYVIAQFLLHSIFLLFAGGILLLFVAWRLYREIHHAQAESAAAKLIGDVKHGLIPPSLPQPTRDVRRAILKIAIADLSMSLDNVLAVAGAAMNHVWVLAVGLLLSIVLIGFAASVISNLLQRYPWISYAGLTIIVYVALRMIWLGGVQVMHAA